MRLAVLVCAALIADVAIAQAPAPSVVARALAATCTSCHGVRGDADVPSLAGVARDDIVRKMNEFKAGTRPATVMQQLAKGYSGEQIEAIAAWFAAQKPAQ